MEDQDASGINSSRGEQGSGIKVAYATIKIFKISFHLNEGKREAFCMPLLKRGLGLFVSGYLHEDIRKLL